MSNHLSGESSPYLQQHAENPVDWYPWGEEALAKARAEQKLIFLSIGYAACHWCHVMAHESFEDEATAAILNAHFVSIKVDREERPDLDAIYMKAIQTMIGSGGWPMSVFLTPEGLPFYGGTYFPPQPRYQLPSFKQVLLALAEAWDQHRDDLLHDAGQVAALLQAPQESRALAGEGAPVPETLEAAYTGLQHAFDEAHGGWGDGPKFPQPMVLEFLLRYHATTGDPQALALVTQTLEAMARGGIYDQLGGGFHRYAVNEDWSVPHFEKMLYDNAQLARVYLHAWQVTGEPLFRAVVEETLDYVIREMTAPEGGFYATQDADSEGKEGEFFLWTAEEVIAVLGDDAPRFMQAYGVSAKGNFEGRTILSLKGSIEERQALAEARRKLFLTRTQRPHPGRDAKVLTSWNGLMLAAFAEAAQALGREDYRQAAAHSAAFLIEALYRPGGRLWHVWKDGKARIEGYLEDYAALIEGLLALYQATFEPRWSVAAEALAEAMIARFSAERGFYDTADDAEVLLLRPRETQDSATPCGNSMAATALLRLARMSGEDRYRLLAEESLTEIQPLAKQYPLAFGQWLIALDDAVSTTTEIAIIGAPDHEETQALLKALPGGYHPHRLIAVGIGPHPGLLQERPQINGKATAYLCRGSTCRPPVTEPEALNSMLVQPD